ncbi:hypothetical protein M0R45_020200 [Rubus argutus]|uniref:Uncharacterized protein n=1 Tax=Rubus argutus TaxID=59490 RepID=A0AAW1XA14_RUBAR
MEMLRDSGGGLRLTLFLFLFVGLLGGFFALHQLVRWNLSGGVGLGNGCSEVRCLFEVFMLTCAIERQPFDLGRLGYSLGTASGVVPFSHRFYLEGGGSRLRRDLLLWTAVSLFLAVDDGGKDAGSSWATVSILGHEPWIWFGGNSGASSGGDVAK